MILKQISFSGAPNNNKHGVFLQFRNAPNLFLYWVLACNWNKPFMERSTFSVSSFSCRCGYRPALGLHAQQQQQTFWHFAKDEVVEQTIYDADSITTTLTQQSS